MAEESESNSEPEEMAEEILKAVEEQEEDDGLTEREREIELEKEEERIRKAKKLKKQLRKRELGLLHYRWPAAVLVLAGILSIITEFGQVMTRPPEIGFDSFLHGFTMTGNLFFLFPVIAGALFILCGIWAYSDPRATFASLIPGMLMAMSGAEIYLLVGFAVEINPDAEVATTGIPLSMLIVAALSILGIFMREKE
ncbi:hypothetical protein EU538_10395 [Candidatus Thorarchaeota archaeon]|jgi:hypothetical protein|nr:MAG: hypothetical protein EU538_10395 [Candidatus Thorarchaeota archaeon]